MRCCLHKSGPEYADWGHNFNQNHSAHLRKAILNLHTNVQHGYCMTKFPPPLCVQRITIKRWWRQISQHLNWTSIPVYLIIQEYTWRQNPNQMVQREFYNKNHSSNSIPISWYMISRTPMYCGQFLPWSNILKSFVGCSCKLLQSRTSVYVREETLEWEGKGAIYPV